MKTLLPLLLLGVLALAPAFASAEPGPECVPPVHHVQGCPPETVGLIDWMDHCLGTMDFPCFEL